jgi:hypothetical protein
MDDKEESCCTIDYEHHKEIFERRRQAFLKDPEKAVTTHQAKIRLIKDHYKEAQVPGGYAIACDEPVEREVWAKARRRCSIWSPPSGFDC